MYGYNTILPVTERIGKGILNVELDVGLQWKQATLPIRDGGLGIRLVSMLASSAYLQLDMVAHWLSQ